MNNIKCTNSFCRYNYLSGNRCYLDEEIGISKDGCDHYKNGIHYYVNLVWNKLKKSNFIADFCIERDLQIGLFIVMKLYNLSFRNARGTITLYDKNDNGPLNYEDIISLDMDHEELYFFIDLFLNNKDEEYFDNLMGKKNKNEESENEEIDDDDEDENEEYGWLSPSGEFLKGEFGTHSAMAYEIMRNRKYKDDKEYKTVSDLLVYKYNWALIDNPTQYGIPKVTCNEMKLTKHQRDFLFNYFTNLGYKQVAKRYLED